MITVRHATVDDAPCISAFLITLSEEFIVGEFSAEGRRHFLAHLAESQMTARLAFPEFRFHVAEDGADLAGVVAMRGLGHLYYLFVGRRWQRTGLARRLWQLAKDDAITAGHTSGRFTVNASRHAIGAYVRLGFCSSGPEQETNGVLYQPMVWTANEAPVTATTVQQTVSRALSPDRGCGRDRNQ